MKKLNFRHAHSPVKLSEDSNIQAKYNVDIQIEEQAGQYSELLLVDTVNKDTLNIRTSFLCVLQKAVFV